MTRKIGNATLWLGDCLERMADLPDQSVDMVLCDLPYGTTDAAWDSVIPFPDLWAHYKRLVKPKGAIVLTAVQPFTTEVIASNRVMFKYCWYWEKSQGANFFLASYQPLKVVEDIVVFSSSAASFNKAGNCMTYNPQKPVPLLEYLIRTYSNAGDTVLDNCMGSASTGAACANTGRTFIGIEQEQRFFDISCNRLEALLSEPKQNVFDLAA